MGVRFEVKIQHDEEDGLFYASCLDLQGCHTFGSTREEAIERIQELILDHLQARFHVQQIKRAGPPNTELVAIEA